MEIKRWVGLLLSMALPLLALSCGEEGAPPGQEPGQRQREEERLPLELSADEEKLRSMVLTVQEVGEVLPGVPWIQRESGSTFGPQGVPEDRRAAALLAAWTAVYDSGEEPEGEEAVTTDLFLYETANAASAALKEKLGELQQEEDGEIGEFDVAGIGDQGQSVVTRPPGGRVFTGVFLQLDRVLAFTRVGRSDDEDMSEQARQLAAKQAKKIEALFES